MGKNGLCRGMSGHAQKLEQDDQVPPYGDSCQLHDELDKE
jgi:hypothetical protein